MLDADLLARLREVFAKLDAPMALVVRPSDHEKQSELVELVREVASTSPWLSLREEGERGPDLELRIFRGDTPTGVHDLAGNVAEWVGDRSSSRGGSFATTLAPELRTWAREDLPEGARSDAVGFRCVYPP